MGHLINPISTRLSFSTFWLSSWTDVLLKDFSYNLMLDKGFAALLDWVFIHSWFAQSLTKLGIFLSHYRFIRRGNKFRVHCFLVYNSSLILKSSFVESGLSSLPTDWSTLWNRKSYFSKAKSRNSDLLNRLSVYSKNNFNSKERVKLFESLRKSIESQKKSFSLTGGSRFLKVDSLKADSVIRSGLLYKKIALNKLFDGLNSFFLNLLSTLFNQFFYKINLPSAIKIKKISLGIKFLDSFNIINPQFIARFIARRISYGFQLQRVLKPLIRDLTLAMSKRKNKIVGFRIACSGRFDRKQIASYIWQKFGPVSLNKFAATINYGFATSYLKYGTCGIKVWVASRHQPISSQFSNKTVFLKLLWKVNFLNQLNSISSNSLTASRFNVFLIIIKLFEIYKNNNGVGLGFLKLKFKRRDLLLSPLGLGDFFRSQLFFNSWLKYENKYLFSKK